MKMLHRKVSPPSLTKNVLELMLAESYALIQKRYKRDADHGFIRAEPVVDKLKQLYEKYCLWATVDHIVELSLETTDLIIDVSGGPYIINDTQLILKPYSIDGGDLVPDTLSIPIDTIMGHHLTPLNKRIMRETHKEMVAWDDYNANQDTA